jgi:hypothetical protein
MHSGKDFIWTPLQQMAIEFNKDSGVFGKRVTKPSQGDAGRPKSWNSSGVIVDSHHDKEERTAKDYAQARYEKIKSWWDSKRNGGNKEP